jgi:DNA-binding NarL/FixJ family response regulator
MITVGLADDHVIVRQGLRLLVQTDPMLSVVGEAANGLEAMAMVKRLKPHVLLLDLMMPAPDGLEVTRRLTRLKLPTRVIILTMYGDAAFLLDALKAGAAGYVVKESCGTELLRAIHEVAAGRRYLSPTLDAIVKTWSSRHEHAAAGVRKAAKPARPASRAL